MANILPRLLYIGDLPVEATYHGSALLYRLLERYPAERLCIAEAGPWVSRAVLRLKGVRYEDRRTPWPWLAHTRFARLYQSLFLTLAHAGGWRFKSLICEFQPEAILSVAHGFSFFTAASVAKKAGVPLHLICHDEWSERPLLCNAACKERVFGKLYRAAASRLCVSPFMAEAYENRYHARGSVLYPSRASEQSCSRSRPPDWGGRMESSCVHMQGTLPPNMQLR